tara:strand:+ start:2552 stop:3274 length:723 start_codon:yes stop_codon:yes gene_type:complete
MEKKIRINKFLSESGYCSRRKADKMIEDGRIKINGILCVMGEKVSISDKISIDDKLIHFSKKEPIYIAFNKPTGVVCTTDTRVEKNNIIDYIGHPERIFPIGRLDKDSQGLILLTNDGDIVNKILRSRNNHQKEYIVRVDKPITNDFIQRMSNGVPILDTITKKCYVNKISNFEFKIILTQGLNRQIRRMCEVLKYKVKKLKRIRIMNIHLNVDLGKWRNLEKKELNELNRLCKESHKTI